jgi:hypothetical protein
MNTKSIGMPYIISYTMYNTTVKYFIVVLYIVSTCFYLITFFLYYE